MAQRSTISDGEGTYHSNIHAIDEAGRLETGLEVLPLPRSIGSMAILASEICFLTPPSPICFDF